jgi:hypothetical protein
MTISNDRIRRDKTNGLIWENISGWKENIKGREM